METQNKKGEWVTAIPLPYYGFKKTCSCGESFWKEINYEEHYIVDHIYYGFPITGQGRDNNQSIQK